MKTIFLIFCFVILSSLQVLAQQECNDVTCPEGWTMTSTGWVTLKVNENPDVYCTVYICYCVDFSEEEGPNFYVKKIMWQDPDCIENVDWEIFKLSMIGEFIKQHVTVFPLTECPDINMQYTCELYISYCLADFLHNGIPTSVACLGDGYCAQAYNYCWDTSTQPWTLVVKKQGQAISYSEDCTEPHPNEEPEWVLINSCYPVCP